MKHKIKKKKRQKNIVNSSNKTILQDILKRSEYFQIPEIYLPFTLKEHLTGRLGISTRMASALS